MDYTLKEIVESGAILAIILAYFGFGFMYPGAPLPAGWERAFFLAIGWILKDTATSIITPIIRKLGF